MRSEIQKLFDVSFPGLTMTDRVWANVLPLCRIQRLAKNTVLFAQGQSTSALFGVLNGELAQQGYLTTEYAGLWIRAAPNKQA